MTASEVADTVRHLSNEELKNRLKMLDSNMRQFKNENNKLKNDMTRVSEELKDNRNKIKQNKQLPWLVSNVVEILDIPTELEEAGNTDPDDKPDGKCLVVKTSTRNTIFLPVPGLVDVVMKNYVV